MFIFSCFLLEILQQNKHISENQEQLTEIKSNLNHEEEQQKELTNSIQELKEELMKKKEGESFLIRGRSVFIACFWWALLLFIFSLVLYWFLLLVAFKILVVSSKNKAAKERVERLCKSKELFEERLGLEIRRIHGMFLQFP